MSWICPFCNHYQINNHENTHIQSFPISFGETKYGEICLSLDFTRCANPSCNEYSCDIDVFKLETHTRANGTTTKRKGDKIETICKRPAYSHKIFPDYVPHQILSDYEEACKILSLSPKASATLIRRCIQGMIRDYCNITGKSLYIEIDKLKSEFEAGKTKPGITSESIEAIDSVRKLGSIGAHMEKDINIILDIDKGEAEALIKLTEMLIEDWYIANHNRIENYKELGEIVKAKSEVKNKQTSPSVVTTAKQD